MFRPNPGGRRPLPADPAGAMPPPALSAPRQATTQGAELDAPNSNPIMRAAGPLLLLLARLRTSLLRAQISTLAPQIAEAIQKFEGEVRGGGVTSEDANRAKYILCATADEVLANLPGEERSAAIQSGLISRFFGESTGGQRFYEEIARAKADPLAHYPILELAHACLALGYQGTRHPLPAGAGSVRELEQDIYATMLRGRPPVDERLSPHWEGQAMAGHAVRLRIPFWAAAGLVGIILFLIYIIMRTLLTLRAESAATTMIALNATTPVTIARPESVPPPSLPAASQTQSPQLDHIRKVLGPNLDAGTLSIDTTANQIIIRVPDQVLFQPGRATVLDDFRPVAMYIALALDNEPGLIKIVGHSDSTPVANARFSSNFELALERARSVAALLKQSLTQGERIEAESKGSDDPIAPLGTAEGRAKNPRIEIVIPRSD